VESSDFHSDDVIKFDLYQCAAAPMTELNIRYITSIKRLKTVGYESFGETVNDVKVIAEIRIFNRHEPSRYSCESEVKAGPYKKASSDERT
jgi:hypothetical protein